MNKKIIILFMFLIIITGCKDKSFKSNKSSNIYSDYDKNKLIEIFDDNNISNIDNFIAWVKDFNKEKDNGCGINKKWVDTNKIKYNDAKCTDRYEKKHSISDGNCRITAFSLLEDLISVNKTISDYGTYLMFDIDVLENNTDYKDINKEKFITVFNEIDLKEEIDIKEVFPNKWKEYDIKINSDNVSLITVVMHDNYDNVLFIGHTGVLINLEDKYLFIEKIAFEQPYQISVFSNLDELRDMLFKRETYFGDTEYGPYIYNNDELLYEYKK